MLQSKRYEIILDKLNKTGEVQVTALSKELNISESTIRRDLLDLQLQQKLVRVHGGAILGSSQQIFSESYELQMDERMMINTEEKKKVAQKAEKLIRDGQCVFIDGGTSTVNIIDELQYRDVKIVTNSELIIKRLNNPVAQITFLGGNYLDKYKMVVGPLALMGINQFNFDACFLSCAGIDFEDNMSYTSELQTLEIKKQAMKNSLNSYLLVDHSKVGVKGFCNFETLDKFDGILIDETTELLENGLENLILVK